MSEVFTKRMTAELDGDFVVFLIGMRFNKLLKVHRWFPVLTAMPKMIKELENKPESGFLSYESYIGRTTLMVQYWQSTEHLQAFANDRNADHYPAWKAFYKAVGLNGDVGLWHETYRVSPGRHESIYINMPPFGLARAGELVEISEAKRTAKARMGAAAKSEQKEAVTSD